MVTLYELKSGVCGQASLNKKYEKYAEEFASLKEGNCAAQGYTVDDGSKDLKVPVLGEIKIALYTKAAVAASDMVTLYEVKAGVCGETSLDKKYESYAEKFASLTEGNCAA